MRIVIVCVGKVRPPFADDVAHYERLLGRLARLETIELAEARADPARPAAALAAEAEAIVRRIGPDSYACALDREGSLVTSESLARFLEERRAGGGDLSFVIGGPFGLGPAALERADRRISLGRITLPHQLARVVLLEQLFRAHKIVLGQRYHY